MMPRSCVVSRPNGSILGLVKRNMVCVDIGDGVSDS